MSGTLISIAIGIGTGLVAYYIAKFIDRRWYEFRASRPIRQFWNFLNQDMCVVLSAPQRDLDRGYRISWTSFGDVQSLRDFYLLLYDHLLSTRLLGRLHRLASMPGRIVDTGHRLSRHAALLGSEEDWSQHRHENLVVIGGPFTNSKTRQLLLDITAIMTPESRRRMPYLVGFLRGRSYDPETFGPRYDREVEARLGKTEYLHQYSDYVFTDIRESKSYEPTIGKGRRLEVDYGMVIKSINPYRPDKCVVLIYGVYDIGTKGTMDLLIDHSKLGSLLHATKASKNIWALVEVSVETSQINDARVVDSGTLQFAAQAEWPSHFEEHPIAPRTG